jgi:uncharacterized protein
VNIFFDTSTLVKLYHKEGDTKKYLDFLTKNPDYEIYLSELALVEIYSAIMKKVRIKHLSLTQAEHFLAVIDDDVKDFHFVQINVPLLNIAQKLVVKYGVQGLRSLDAIQLASAISIKSNLDVALTGDILLKQLLSKEGLNCDF